MLPGAHERERMEALPTPERITRLIRALNDLQVSVVWNATRELARYGAASAQALPALRAALESRDSASRLWARYAIARITNDLPAHLPYFLAALDETTTLFPGMAASVLTAFGPAAHEAVPRLIREFDKADSAYRWGAAGALAAIGPAAAEAVPVLTQALNDADEKVRWYSAWALGEIGSAASPALSALLDRLNDSDEDVRGYAARAIGRIGGPEARAALAALEAMQSEDNENLQAVATEAISRLHPESIHQSETAP